MHLSLEAVADARRPLMLRLVGRAGALHGALTRGWIPVAGVASAVSAVLLVLPAAVNPLFDTVPQSAWDAFGTGRPRLGGLWSISNVLTVAAAIVATAWLLRARKRVVVEDFADQRTSEAKAVPGLATLLIAELGRIQELHGRVGDELSTAPSVALAGRTGTGPGTFLSVSADEVQSTLDDAVATEASVSFGGIKLPIGFLVSVLGRFVRGPRVVGALHAGDDGGHTLTAQVVGPGGSYQWRVDGTDIEPMVAELATRIFTDLTLRSSVRWRAIQAFTEHLDLYWQSFRTPRDRAVKLALAEEKLLEAIAEDDGFDVAYYNLGVVYSQLADAELDAAQRSADLKPEDRPRDAYHARLEAAVVAFNHAVALNPDRSDAIYALAVHEFTRLETYDPDTLQSVICRCERVIELDPRHTDAHHLMAMAQMWLGGNGERSLRTAVRQSWRRLWRVEFGERSAPPARDSQVPAARANLASALSTLAQYNLERTEDDPRRVERADRLYERATELATGATKADTLLAHGQMLEGLGRAHAAAERYHSALKIDPENPVYWAHLAAAYAALPPAPGQEPATFIEGALNQLAPVYRRIVEPHPPQRALPMRDHTLGALSRAYRELRDRAGSSRIAGLVTLGYELEAATRSDDTRALRRLKDRYGDDRAWEREQVQIALARKLGRIGAWREAAAEYEELIALLERVRPDGLVQHSLRSKYARALREQQRLVPALVAAAEGELQNPLSACARREVGEAHFALSQFDEALAAWRETMWLTPNDPYLHWKVAFCHWKVAGDRDDQPARRAALLEAATCFERAALLFGAALVEEWAWSRLWAGRMRHELGERDAAVGHLRAAASCRSTRPAALLLLGEIRGSDAGRRELEAAVAAVTPCSGRLVDAGWGDTLRDHDVAERARALLRRPQLELRAA